MKNKTAGRFAILALAISGLWSIGALAQTTEEGPGPSEQPSASMEVGQQQPSDSAEAQPTEAQPGGPTGEAPATTDQGVARISLIHGDVSTQRGDSGDWSAATLNQPVMTGDKVSTADGARTELQLDFANTLRLGPNTKVNVQSLTKKNIQIQLAEGILDYSVSKDSEAEPEIDTPNVSVHPSHHDGVFRVEVRPDGDTVVIVRQGEAQIATPQGSTEVNAGDMATVRGDASSAQYKIAAAPDRDDWDRWNADRDHIIRDANSYRHTNRRYTGAQDLDAYGSWKRVPDYGDVWVPNEPDGWVPYRDGNWVYEPYYGWTWVGYEPWGWAPYHYGRWFWYGSSWAWWPGPVYAGYNPFWAPAYVSFWGWGGGFGFGVGWGGWGGFGWLPLGPCDWFHPWWGGYRGRFGWVGRGGWNGGWGGRGGWGGHFGGIAPLHNGIRYSNVANIRDGHIGRAMSAVNAGHFGAGRVGAMAATHQQIGGARMMAGNLPVVPTRGSLSASGRAPAAGTMRNSGAQHFFGVTHNNMARPASFQQQTASLRQTMQQSHVGAVPAGGGRFNNSLGARASSNMRPSAGAPATRQMSNFGNRTGSNPAQNAGRGGFNSNSGGNRSAGQSSGFHPFTPPSGGNRSGMSAAPQRGTMQSAPAQNRSFGGQSSGFRPFTPPSNSGRSLGSSNPGGSFQRGTSQAAPAQNRSFGGQSSGFRPFTPPSSSQMSRGANAYSPRSSNGGGTYWNRTTPSSVGRGYGSYGGGYSGGSRPQLDMRQPIARPSYSGGSSRGSYGGNNGGYRASPSYGGGRSAPSYGGGGRSYGGGGGGGGHYSGGGGGGGHSSGGGGGGHSGGGGGGHSGGGRR